MRTRLMRSFARAALGDPFMRLLGRRRRAGLDAALDPQIAAVLELQRLMRVPPLESMTPERARRHAVDGLAPLEVEHAAMDGVIDTTVPGPAGTIPMRIYVPHDAGPNWLVYLHGGGGVIGSIQGSEPVTRLLAAQTGCSVASVGYRLGPEHPHPAAIEDACAAWAAVVARIPRGGRGAIAGDSFGGFLAAHVDRHARLAGARQPDLQVLIYPTTDLTLVAPSIDRYGDGYLLTKSMMRWFRDLYFGPDPDRRTPSPVFWTDLAGAAPAIVVTAGYDPLVDDGDAYARSLHAAGVPVRHHHHPSLVHGFLSLAGLVHAARAAIDRTCEDVVALLAS